MTLARDKQLHLLAGFLIAILVGWVAKSPDIGLGVAILAGFLKELVYDLALKRGHPDYLDFVWTVIGGLLGTALLLFLTAPKVVS